MSCTASEAYAQLRNFQTDLGRLLGSLNGTSSPPKCSFYEEITLQLIIKNVNAIDQGGQLNQTGDIGSDIENVLPKIKRTLDKGFKSCCGNLRDSIQMLKDDIEKSVQKLLTKSNDAENSREIDALRDKLNYFEDHIKELKARLDTIQKDMVEYKATTKCCAELKRQIQALDIKVKTTKSEADEQNQKLYDKIKALMDKQRNQDDIASIVKTTIKDRGENIKIIIDKCEKLCGIEDGSDVRHFEKKDILDFETKIENMQKLIEKLSNKLDEFDFQTTSFNATLQICQENVEKLSKVKFEVQELQNDHICPTASSERPVTVREWSPKDISQRQINCFMIQDDLKDRIKELQEENEILGKKLQKLTKCCQKIDQLGIQADHLKNTLKQMNQTYNDQIKSHENQFKHIQKSLEETLKGLSDINESKIYKGLQEQLKNIDSKINIAYLKLESLSKKQSGTLKIIEGTKNAENLSNEMERLIKDFNGIRQKVTSQLQDFKENKLSEPSPNDKDRDKNIEKLNDIVRQDLDRLKKALLQHNDLEKKVKDKIDNQQTPLNLMIDCQKKCKGINKIKELIDQLEDAEKLAKTY
ncbi:LOW QUALITY PROTEIN: girdin [Drosophila gunungcola]|uniref:LOW QUALITY PROTEIN: girdin n=1 Tax=Drosophila gunungcola TaxID=103775 RepID=UPI0022E594A1|nr:LOW QUALITY PROTEIN: girdin [Drosophila gunungcola]